MQNELKNIYISLGVDLFSISTLIYPFPNRGLDYLEDLLKEKSLDFLIPDLRVTKIVIDTIHNDAFGDDILSVLRALNGVKNSLLRAR